MCRLAVAAAALAVGGTGTSEAPIVDEFDELDSGRWYVSDGWSNGDHQGCEWSAGQVTTSDGRLRLGLEVAPEGGIRCGELQSTETRGYGLYEARMKTAAAPGVVSALFTYTGPPFGTPHDEIDLEFLGRAPAEVQLNYYSGGKGDHEEMVSAPGAGAFGVYGILWMPGRIAWFVDGEMVHEVRRDDIPQTPGKIFFSLWNGTEQVDGWLGSFSAPAGPLTMEVDWFAYTPPGSHCLHPGSVSCAGDWSW